MFQPREICGCANKFWKVLSFGWHIQIILNFVFFILENFQKLHFYNKMVKLIEKKIQVEIIFSRILHLAKLTFLVNLFFYYALSRKRIRVNIFYLSEFKTFLNDIEICVFDL